MISLQERSQSNPSSGPERAAAEGPQPARRAAAWRVAAILLAALAMRAAEAHRLETIHNDAPRFLAIAEHFQQGDWRAAISDDFHPLTGLLIAAVSAVSPLDMPAAGTLLGILFGTLLVAALFVLTREQLGPTAALFAGLCAAVHPRLVSVSSDVQSDGIFLGLFAVSWLAAWRALSRNQTGPALAAGALCGLAYLTRPEGLAIAVVLALWLLADWLRGQRGFLRTLGLGGAFAAALLAVASPYVWGLHELTGSWSLSRKKSITAIAGLDGVLEAESESAAPPLPPAASAPAAEPSASAHPIPTPPPPPPPPMGIGPALREVFTDGWRAGPPAVLLIALLGFRRRRPGPAAFALCAFGALFLGLLIGLHLKVGYVSRRHWLPVVFFVLPFAGRGLATLGSLLQARVPAFGLYPRLAPGLLAAVVAGFIGQRAAHPPNAEKIARREAASWLRAHHTGGGAVAAVRAREAFYAGADQFVPLHEAYTPAAVVANGGADYLLVDETAATPEQLGDRAKLLHRVPYPGGAVLVFAISR